MKLMAVALLLVLWSAWSTPRMVPSHPYWSRPWDHQRYISIYEGHLRADAEYVQWRVGVPYAARALGHLGVPMAWAFWLQAVLGVWLASVALAWICRLRGASDAWATAAGWFVAVSPPAVAWLSDFWLPDPMFFGLSLLAIGLYLAGRWRLALPVFLWAVACKEVALFSLPLAWTLRRRLWPEWLVWSPLLLCTVSAMIISVATGFPPPPPVAVGGDLRTLGVHTVANLPRYVGLFLPFLVIPAAVWLSRGRGVRVGFALCRCGHSLHEADPDRPGLGACLYRAKCGCLRWLRPLAGD